MSSDCHFIATTLFNLKWQCFAVLKMDCNEGDIESSHGSSPWPEESAWSPVNDISEEENSPALSLDSYYLESLSTGLDESLERVLAQCCQAEENDVSKEVTCLPQSKKYPSK